MNRPHANVFVLLMLALGLASAGDEDYRPQVDKERRAKDEFLKSATGPLALVGRFVLQQGSLTLGNDPASTIVLPSRAPKHVGTVHRQGDRFSFEVAPETQVSVNGKQASGSSPLQVQDSRYRGDAVSFGDFSFVIRSSGDQFDLLLEDAQSPYVKAFKGTTWFPVDPAYRVTAEYKPLGKEKAQKLALTDGATRLYKVAGEVVFQLNGQTVQMEVLSATYSEQDLFIMFRDDTSGKDTYAGGRSVDVDPSPDGKLVLDFNTAANPLCAYNPYNVCAITPKGNRLAFPVRAGETYQNRE